MPSIGRCHVRVGRSGLWAFGRRLPADRHGPRRGERAPGDPHRRRHDHRPGRGDVGGLRHAARGGAPRRRHPRAAAPRNRSRARRPGPGEGHAMNSSVLIVDDSLTVRMDLADAFEAAGLHSVQCATTAHARDALLNETICLVVLDVLLPDGDGVDLLRDIRLSPERGSLPVILLSSEAEVKDRIRGLKTGADEYIGKPYDSKYVIAKARELLRARAA